MKMCFFVFCILTSFSSYSQSQKEKSTNFDLSRGAEITGAAAVPVGAMLGAHKLIDTFKYGETVIYGGLSGQPMTQDEISRTIKRASEQKAFERSKYIIVNNSRLDTRDYTADEFKSKLNDYSINKNGVDRIAIQNRHVSRGMPTAVGIGATVLLFVFSDSVRAGEAIPVTEDTDRADFKRQSWARPKKE